jgi:hypothetical protein
MSKYRIYIDEVGNPDLESSDNPNHRFLSLTGVVIELQHVKEIVHPQMEEIKSKYFSSHPDDPIIFHRKEMVNAKYPFEALKNQEIRNQFDNELLKMVSSWEYTVISVCLDKKKHKDTYGTWRYDPYHYCLAVLLERFVLMLSRMECNGDVMAESRGGKEDMRLKASFHKLWEEGTGYIDSEQFKGRLTSRQLKVKPKSQNVSGLQLADLLAHPSRNEILLEQGLLDKELAPFAKRVVGILQEKYDQKRGKIFGKKFL